MKTTYLFFGVGLAYCVHFLLSTEGGLGLRGGTLHTHLKPLNLKPQTVKVCAIIASMAVVLGLGLLFYILLGSR